MRGIIAFVVVVLLMVLVGWLSFGVSSDRATINLETEEIREDTASAVEATQSFAEDAAEGVREMARDADEHVDVDVDADGDGDGQAQDRDAPATTDD